MTRVHGRPVEKVEIDTGTDQLGVVAMTPAERARLIGSVLDQYPHLAPLAPGTQLVHI